MGSMRRHVFKWVLGILGLAACIPMTRPTPLFIEVPTPSSPAPTSSPSVIPREQPATITPRPSPTAPSRIGSSQRIPPLPDGFHTEGDWLMVFRPAVERQRWSEGTLWLTDGQRWWGPWPPDLFMPTWTVIEGQGLHLCHRWAEKDRSPVCVPVPPALGIQPGSEEETPPVYSIRAGTGTMFPCEGEQALCFRFPDGALSRPIRFPLPAEVSLRDYFEEQGDLSACLTPDREHAIVNLGSIGGPAPELSAEYEEKPLKFPGALYWVDLRSGQVRAAPTNAPDPSVQQALVRSLGDRGNLPAALIPFYATVLGPMSSGIGACSPSGAFAIWWQTTWRPGNEVYFPADVARRFEDSVSPPTIAPIEWAWVVRLRDGAAYPLTAVEIFFYDYPQRVLVDWIPHRSYWKAIAELEGIPRPADYSLPWSEP